MHSHMLHLLCLTSALLSYPLAAQEVDVSAKVQVCFACHGPEGASTQANYPILAGQQEYYLYVQMKDFQAGRRENAEMAPMLANLTRDEMKAIAKYFAGQSWPRLEVTTDPEHMKAGRTAAAAGQCPQCHLGGYNGNSRVPRLAGLHPEYLAKTMLDFKAKRRNNSPAKSSLMESFSEEDILAMAQYIGSLTVYERSQGAEIE